MSAINSLPIPCEYSISATQRNIIETQINYPGIDSTPLSIDQVTFTKDSDANYFTITMKEGVNTPCIHKCIEKGVIKQENIQKSKYIVNKINKWKNKENIYHKSSKVSYLITFDNKISKKAYVASICNNPSCNLLNLSKDNNKYAIWKNISMYLTKALFEPPKETLVVPSVKPIVPSIYFQLSSEPDTNPNEEECPVIENCKKVVLKRRYNYSIFNSINVLDDIFWDICEKNNIIICDKNEPGYIWSLNVCLWKLSNKRVIINHLLLLIKPLLQDLIKMLSAIEIKSNNDTKKLNQLLFIAEGLDTNFVQNTIYSHIQSKRKIITTNINIKLNVKFLSQLDRVDGIVNTDSDQLVSMSHLFPIKGNKILDLSTKTVRDRVPNDFFTFECPINYIEMIPNCVDTGCSRFPNADKFFSNICSGNMEMVKYNQMMLGYCLTGETKNESLYIHCGSGKDILWKIMRKILDKFFVLCSDEILTEHVKNNVPTPGLCKLVHARVALMVKTRKNEGLDILPITQITHGETISAREAHGLTFDFTSISKVVLIHEKKPIIDNNELINITRFILFDGKFEEPRENYIKSLLNDHLDEIFSFLVEGAHEYYLTKSILIPEGIKLKLFMYDDVSTSISCFLSLYFEMQPDDSDEYMIEKRKMFRMYNKWCKKTNAELLESDEFYSLFDKRFPIPVHRKNCTDITNNVKKRYYFGVRMINKFNPSCVIA